MRKRQKETDTNLRLILKASVIVFVSVIFSKLFNYGYKVLIARGFGAESYGLFSLATIIVGVFAAIFAFGLSDGLIRYIPLFRGENALFRAKPLVKRTLIILPIMSVMSLILLLVLSNLISISIFKEPNLLPYLRIVGLSIPFIILGGVFLTIIRAFENIALYTFLNNIFQNGIKLLSLSILIFIGFGFYPIAVSYVITYFLFFLGAYFFSRKYIAIIKKERGREEHKEDIRNFLSYSWPFIFTSLLFSIFYSTDSLILGYFGGAEKVGIYNAAITISSLFFIAPDLFMQLLLPMLSKFSTKKKSLVQDLTKQVSKWIYLINLPLGILIIIFPGVFINVMFGAEFLFAEQALRILAIGGLFAGFLSLLTGLISAKGLSKTILKNFVFLTIINIVLDIILVPRYGLNGAAIATVISWVSLVFVLTLQTKRVYGYYPWMRILIKISALSIVPIIAIYLLSIFITPSIPIMSLIALAFFIVYFLLLLVFKCLNKNDLILLNAVRHRVSNYLKN